MTEPKFESASPYADDILALPVTDIDVAAEWYAERFGMTEISRQETPAPSVVLERDGIRIGFAINGRDPSQEGAAIRVSDIEGIRNQLQTTGANPGDFRIDDHDGKKMKVFFVVAPDGLCFYFHEPVG